MASAAGKWLSASRRGNIAGPFMSEVADLAGAARKTFAKRGAYVAAEVDDP